MSLPTQRSDEKSFVSLTHSQSQHENNHIIGGQVLMSVAEQRNEFKNDEKQTQPLLNNQSTILMAARSCRGGLMLMHETRIFYFEKITCSPKKKCFFGFSPT